MHLVLSVCLFITAVLVLVLWFWVYRMSLQTAGWAPKVMVRRPEPAAAAGEERTNVDLGISTGIFYERDILEVLPLIKETGFDVVEVWAGPDRSGSYLHFDWHERYRVQALALCLKALGMRVSSLHAPFSDTLDLSSPNELRRRFAVSETLRTLEVLKALGGEYLVVHPASSEQSLRNRDAHFRASRKSIEEIAACLGELGLKMAVENQLPHILGGDIPTLLALIDGLPQESVGVCFDTSHANLYRGRRLDEHLQQLASRVMTLHISDNYGERDDHFIVGDGHIDWPAFVAALRKAEYRGIFMLEIVGEVNQRDRTTVLRSGYSRARQILAPAPAV